MKWEWTHEPLIGRSHIPSTAGPKVKFLTSPPAVVDSLLPGAVSIFPWHCPVPFTTLTRPENTGPTTDGSASGEVSGI